MDRFSFIDSYQDSCRGRDEGRKTTFYDRNPAVTCLATRMAPRDQTGRIEPVYDLYTPAQCAACEGPPGQGRAGPLYQCIALWYGCTKPREDRDYVTFYEDPMDRGLPDFRGHLYDPREDGIVSECGSCSMCVDQNSARLILDYEIDLRENRDVEAIRDAYMTPRLQALLPPHVCVPTAWAISFKER